MKLNASFAKAYFLRGAIRLRQGNNNEAKAAFETAAKLAGDPVLKSLCTQIIAQIGA